MSEVTKKVVVLFLLVGSTFFSVQANESQGISFSPSLKANPVTTDFLKNSKIVPRFESRYIGLDGQANSANLFIVKVAMDFEHKILTNFHFYFDGGANFERGNSDSLFDNNLLRPESSLTFRRAEFVWSPVSKFQLIAGAVRMGDSEQNTDIMFGRGAFLGTKQVYLDGYNNYFWQLSALQAIPNSRNNSNRIDDVEQGNPQFFMEMLTAGYASNEDQLRVYGSIGHFAFDRLNNSLADRSRYIGNSVFVYSGIDNAEFIYSYQGWFSELGLDIEIGNFRIAPELERVQNTAAPRSNQGYGAEIEFGHIMGDSELRLIVNEFRMEADATVGALQSRSFGHVNHEGRALRIEYEDLKEELILGLGVSQMREIELNQLTQRDVITGAGLSIRKRYDFM